jgi:hypothetical protein
VGCQNGKLLDGEILYTLKEGADRDRKLAPALQRRTTPCLARLQTAGAGGVRPRVRRVAVCAPSNCSDGHAPVGAETAAKLTLQLDHSMGADHRDRFRQFPRLVVRRFPKARPQILAEQ